MYLEDTPNGEATSQERRDAAQNDKRTLGNVVRCDGARSLLLMCRVDVGVQERQRD